nr:hypothetical protein [Ningiella sp. W23]
MSESLPHQGVIAHLITDLFAQANIKVNFTFYLGRVLTTILLMINMQPPPYGCLNNNVLRIIFTVSPY